MEYKGPRNEQGTWRFEYFFAPPFDGAVYDRFGPAPNGYGGGDRWHAVLKKVG